MCPSFVVGDLSGENVHKTTIAGFPFKLDGTRDLGKKSVVGSHANIFAGMELSAALADNDHARFYFLSAEYLDSQPLAGRIAAVCGRSLCFCMCHCVLPRELCNDLVCFDFFDLQLGKVLPVPLHFFVAFF
jgi:hypothetical protein